MGFDFIILIYTIKDITIMKKQKSKKPITVSLNRKIFNIIDDKFNNKSKYIEWLIYQDLLKNTNDGELKNILL